MKILQETTDWGEYNTPNNIYYVNDSKEKLLAYIKAGSNEPVMLSKPIKFSTRYRTFKELDSTPAPSNLIQIQGSKGAVYTVDPESQSCSCPGFTFRGDCKHVKELAI